MLVVLQFNTEYTILPIFFSFQVREMRKETPEDYFYYRPCTRASEEVHVVTNPEEDDIMYQQLLVENQELENQMLFIHMTAAQRHILAR